MRIKSKWHFVYQPRLSIEQIAVALDILLPLANGVPRHHKNHPPCLAACWLLIITNRKNVKLQECPEKRWWERFESWDGPKVGVNLAFIQLNWRRLYRFVFLVSNGFNVVFSYIYIPYHLHLYKIYRYRFKEIWLLVRLALILIQGQVWIFGSRHFGSVVPINCDLGTGKMFTKIFQWVRADDVAHEHYE